MSRHSPRSLRTLALGLLACYLVTGLAVAQQRPNIVVILADDLGFSDLGCYGGEIETPNLDALAARGVRFTQFYNTAKCHSTRVSLLTGRYYTEVGEAKLTECITLAEGLRRSGYSTLMTGKWHLKGNPVERGFERYFGHLSGATNFFRGDRSFRLDEKAFEVPEKGFYNTDANVDYALRFLDESTKPDKPFFLYLAFNAPHYPLHVKEADYRKYEHRFEAGWDSLRRKRHERMVKLGVIDPSWSLPPRPEDVPAWNTLSDEKKKEHTLTMAAYAGMVDCLDQNVGRLIDKLKEMGRFENTLILFLSDNGACPFQRTKEKTRSEWRMPWRADSYWTYDKGWAHFCNTPLRLYKRNQHEGGIATPFIAHWPKGLGKPGRFSGEVGHLVDIMPTVLELAGLSYEEASKGHEVGPLRGRSLVPVLKGRPPRPRDELWFLYGPNRALRQGDWKLVSHDRKPWELYRVASDRTERRDLAAAKPELVARMAERWNTLAKEYRAPNPGKNAGGKKRRKKKPSTP